MRSMVPMREPGSHKGRGHDGPCRKGEQGERIGHQAGRPKTAAAGPIPRTRGTPEPGLPHDPACRAARPPCCWLSILHWAVGAVARPAIGSSAAQAPSVNRPGAHGRINRHPPAPQVNIGPQCTCPRPGVKHPLRPVPGGGAGHRAQVPTESGIENFHFFSCVPAGAVSGGLGEQAAVQRLVVGDDALPRKLLIHNKLRGTPHFRGGRRVTQQPPQRLGQ